MLVVVVVGSRPTSESEQRRRVLAERKTLGPRGPELEWVEFI